MHTALHTSVSMTMCGSLSSLKTSRPSLASIFIGMRSSPQIFRIDQASLTVATFMKSVLAPFQAFLKRPACGRSSMV